MRPSFCVSKESLCFCVRNCTPIRMSAQVSKSGGHPNRIFLYNCRSKRCFVRPSAHVRIVNTTKQGVHVWADIWAPAPGMMGDPIFGARRARKRAPGERHFLFNFGSFWNGPPGRVVTFKTCNCLSKEPCKIDFAMPKKHQTSEPIRSAKNEPSRSIILVFAALPFVPKTRLK